MFKITAWINWLKLVPRRHNARKLKRAIDKIRKEHPQMAKDSDTRDFYRKQTETVEKIHKATGRQYCYKCGKIGGIKYAFKSGKIKGITLKKIATNDGMKLICQHCKP